MASCDKNDDEGVYQEWMSLQGQELSELQHEVTEHKNDAEMMKQAVDKIIRHFEEYVKKRGCLLRRDVSAFLSPMWCKTLENSFSWVAGCRPSSFFRIIYALCVSDIDSRLHHFFLQNQDGTSSDFPYLSACQLSSLDNLQRKTVAEEEKLSSEMAKLQEDTPFAMIARQSDNLCPVVRDVLNKINDDMVSAVEQADMLRMNTLKEIIIILTPVQAVDLTVSAKKLRLCMQA